MKRLGVIAVLLAISPAHADPNTTVVFKRTLDHGAVAEVRKIDSNADGVAYQVALCQHQRCDTRPLAVQDESCGAGHCTYEKVIGFQARRVGKRVRATVRKESHHVTNDCTEAVCDEVSESDLVVDF